jgi:lipid-A-disaccharide synthase
MNDSDKILIVAGEESSSVYAQRLLEHWNRTGMNVKAFGVGSVAMERLGMERIGKSQEVAAHFRDIYRVFHQLLKRAQEERPQVALLLDYPDFNLRLAKKLKQLGIPVIYYISPQIWAWRSSRVHTIKKYVDKMLVVFPFEVDFYQRHGVPVEFVGHPLLDELDETTSFNFEGEIRLGLMPGSRKSELKHHLKTQLQAAEIFKKSHPGARVSLLVAPSIDKVFMQSQIDECGVGLQGVEILQEAPKDMINKQDLLLCASGTATLMVGLLGRPFVAMYKMNSFSAFLARKLIRTVDHFCIVNLILQKRAISELFQEEASPERLAQELSRVVSDTNWREQILEDLGHLRSLLGQRGATEQVHKNLLRYWQGTA